MGATLIDKEGVESSPTSPDLVFRKRHHFIEYPSKKLFFILPDIEEMHGYGISVFQGIGYFISQFYFMRIIMLIHVDDRLIDSYPQVIFQRSFFYHSLSLIVRFYIEILRTNHFNTIEGREN
jgi:hypothetical protein